MMIDTKAEREKILEIQCCTMQTTSDGQVLIHRDHYVYLRKGFQEALDEIDAKDALIKKLENAYHNNAVCTGKLPF